jgi:signal transduction histidine kinase
MSSSKEACARLMSLTVHELRTPASVVGGYLRMLQRDSEPLSDRHRKLVDEAEKSCARLVAIVAELSDVSKLDSGAIALAQQPFDVFAALADVASSVHEGEDRGVRLELRGEASGARVTGDLTRVQNAFGAIFKAILREQGSACTVVVDRRREQADGLSSAVIVVAEGSNVQEQYDTRVPFDEKRGGMGLALPLARRVIEGHGGRMESPAGDAGRRVVIVTLPLRESDL